MLKTIRSNFHAGEVIDTHVHIGGPARENEEMYYWSPRFEKSLAFDGMKLVTRIAASRMCVSRYVTVLFNQISQSRHVDKLVLLAMDAVYREDGGVDRNSTHLFVDNAFIGHLSQIYPQFLFGCSVHPYAPDAAERLWKCAQAGAVLCKWLPSTQSIDPTHPLSVRFYRALAELDMPLLLHVGPEGAIPCNIEKQDELRFNAACGRSGADPGDAISLALDAGARVIVAHCATPAGRALDRNNAYWEKVFQTFLKLFDDYADMPLYADTSAFCLPGRLDYIKEILPRIRERPHKFLFASDFPVPVIALSKGKKIEEILEAFEWLAERTLPVNDFDKNFKLLRPHLPDPTLHAACRVLRPPRKSMLPLNKYLSRLGGHSPLTAGRRAL